MRSCRVRGFSTPPPHCHRLRDQHAGVVHRGQVQSDMIGRAYGLLHEIPDQLGILRSLTKWAERIDHPTEAGKRVNEAFRQLRDGRPRPVGLEIPPDVLALATEVALPAADAGAAGHRTRPRPDR